MYFKARGTSSLEITTLMLDVSGGCLYRSKTIVDALLKLGHVDIVALLAYEETRFPE